MKRDMEDSEIGDFGFWISDFGFVISDLATERLANKSAIRNPKSEISFTPPAGPALCATR